MSYIERFESVGDNCEFGFVQRAFGSESGGLFKWAFIPDYADLVKTIEGDFSQFYRFENLVPTWSNMVEDKGCKLCFHTEIFSSRETESSPWVFNGTHEEQFDIYCREIEKMRYLVGKFKEGIASGNRIYVAKKNGNSPMQHIRRLQDALDQYGRSTILLITESQPYMQPGTVTQVGDRLCVGYIDRFADYGQADNISLKIWTSILERANNLFPIRSSPVETDLQATSAGLSAMLDAAA
jgi:hypothetical protein